MDEKLIILNSVFPYEEDEEAFSSITLNPTVTWVKFILTDDAPNGNNQRVPGEEFDNIIKTGTNMPIKMAVGGINEGHEESLPIGVITHLKQFKNKIIGLAALWARERPEDVQLIKDKYSKKEPLELSWELLYKMSSITEAGIQELKDVALRAVTFVGRPAFEGRTPVLAVAAKTDTSLEDTKLEELEVLQKKVAELEGLLVEKDATIASKDAELVSVNAELTPLKEFKATIDREKEEADKLAAIIKKFTDSGLNKPVEYFATNKQMLLGMSEAALDFMLQELVAFSSANDATASKKDDKGGAPDLSGVKSVKDMTPVELGALLRQSESKK